MCEEKNGLRNLNRAIVFLNWSIVDFSSGSDDKESAYNARNSGLIPGLGRSPGRGNDKPLQYSCLENSVDRGAWRATVHGVAKSRTRLRDLHTHTHTHTQLIYNVVLLSGVQHSDSNIYLYLCIYLFLFIFFPPMLLLLLLSHFSRVRLCVTPQTAAHQAPPSLGFSRREHWSGLPFPSPMRESEKWNWSCSVVSDS